MAGFIRRCLPALALHTCTCGENAGVPGRSLLKVLFRTKSPGDEVPWLTAAPHKWGYMYGTQFMGQFLGPQLWDPLIGVILCIRVIAQQAHTVRQSVFVLRITRYF
jgi:hypothetical protein